MTNYQVHPDSFSSIELRDGESIDDYIAKARRFGSTAEFREFRDASPERRKAMQRRNQGNDSATSDDDIDRRRTLTWLLSIRLQTANSAKTAGPAPWRMLAPWLSSLSRRT
jgi:hypothetical protein